MSNVRRTSLFVILTLLGLLLSFGAADAGVIAGKFYETDGVTQITKESITIQVVDSAGTTTAYGGNYTGGTYSINIGSLTPADKTISFVIIRGGVNTTTLSGLNGNPQRPQTIDIIVHK
jgi:hypothetical protein